MALFVRLLTLLIGITTVTAADLHPIVEVQTGYLFGASSNGKWIKADEVAKSLSDQTPYRVYGMTAALGEVKGGKANPEEVPCEQTLAISLSPKSEKGVVAIAAPWNALPRRVMVLDPNQKVYADAVGDFLKTKGIDQPKVKIDNIIRVDLDGDGEEEVLISATNYFGKKVPMRSLAGSYSMVLLRRMVGGKIETQLVDGEFYPKAYVSSDQSSFNAPNAYKVIAVLDLDGDGKLEIVVAWKYYEGEGTTIYRYDPKKCQQVLGVGCGA
ncbi:MAG TPA: VCBS repeat-containing protein [Chthoniobacterales bacterium]|nr:VCBS repeat-containing protein [Chthoniobacterales bacterium]